MVYSRWNPVKRGLDYFREMTHVTSSIWKWKYKTSGLRCLTVREDFGGREWQAGDRANILRAGGSDILHKTIRCAVYKRFIEKIEGIHRAEL